MALDREETELKAELERISQNIDVILKRVALQLTEVAQQRKSNSSLEGAEAPGFMPASHTPALNSVRLHEIKL